MLLNELLRQCFDKVSSNGTCLFSDYIDSILENTEDMESCFTGYSNEYKEYTMRVLRTLKDTYREPVFYWCEITHLLSKHLGIKLYGERTSVNYEREIYRKYLLDCGAEFEESSPTKKRKRYECSYVAPTIEKTDLYNSRFAPLTLQEEELIENRLVDSENNVLVEKFYFSITRQTMMELYENQWLNDDVINFYMEMLHQRDIELCGRDITRRSSHYYSCYFMKLLLPQNGYDYSNVKKWSKKFKVFEKDKIFCPVNVNDNHWSMLIIYVQEKKIAYYDSMQVNGKKYLESALQYLADESLTMNLPFDKEQWEFIMYTDRLPLQENDYDCGVFVLMYADFITNDLPLVFGQEHMELFRKKMCVAILQEQPQNTLNQPELEILTDHKSSSDDIVPVKTSPPSKAQKICSPPNIANMTSEDPSQWEDGTRQLWNMAFKPKALELKKYREEVLNDLKTKSGGYKLTPSNKTKFHNLLIYLPSEKLEKLKEPTLTEIIRNLFHLMDENFKDEKRRWDMPLFIDFTHVLIQYKWFGKEFPDEIFDKKSKRKKTIMEKYDELSNKWFDRYGNDVIDKWKHYDLTSIRKIKRVDKNCINRLELMLQFAIILKRNLDDDTHSQITTFLQHKHTPQTEVISLLKQMMLFEP